jgi:hypothetical protein
MAGSDERGRGGSVSAGVGLAKESITSHPRRPIGMVELLIIPLATKARMTVPDHSAVGRLESIDGRYPSDNSRHDHVLAEERQDERKGGVLH